jgi:hypothetical protein
MGFNQYRQVKAQEESEKAEIVKPVKEKTVTERPQRGNKVQQAARRQLTICQREIEKLEEENAEAERDCTAAADDLEVAQKALREAESAKRNAETMLDAAKKLADANAKEKDKAVAAKAAAEKKEADLQKQLNDATEEIRRLEAEAQEKPEPEQITMEAAVSEEALEAQREKIAAEEREKLQEELRAEYEKKLSAAANPDAQRAAMHFESMVNSYGQLKKALERLPEDMAAKIRAKVSQAVSGMLEEMSDDAS